MKRWLTGVIVFGALAGCRGEAEPPVADRAGPLVEGGPPRLVRVVAVTGEGTFLAPRFSPDGRWLLFAGVKFDGLYVAEAEANRSVRQVSGEEYVGWPARWRADGIVTRTRDRREVRFRDPLGTPVREETGEVHDPKTAPGPVSAFAEEDRIHLVTGGKDAVISGPEDQWFGPVVSPDGRSVVYNGLSTGIVVHDVATGKAVTVARGTHPVWMPDSSGLVYDVTEDDGRDLTGSELWLWTRADRRSTQLTDTPDRIEIDPAVSPDGRRLAFASNGIIFVGDLECAGLPAL